MMGFPGGSVVKNPPTNAGDMGLIPESGRSPGEGNGNSLQNSCLGNSMNRGVWRATVHGGGKESNTTKQLNKNNKAHYKPQFLLLLLLPLSHFSRVQLCGTP